ncbi:iron-containing redox enzyme family protein [Streptomyces sp. NPDC088387]|uniref:iron-containing redox enzyme family protein n=1 Tax=Streptomyces sp. NPDC088387 TaxID=3365859 RepID=UPI00380E5B49
MSDENGVPDAGELARQAALWSAAEADRFRERLGDRTSDEQVVHCLLLNSAPLALAAGAWLQWASSSANGDSALALEVLSLYADDIGVGYPHADRGSAYRGLLAHHRLPLDTGGVGLTGSDRVQSFSFRLPARLTAISRQPDHFLPHILGADLFLRAVGTPPPLAVLPDAARGPATAHDLDLGSARSAHGPSALDRSLAAARLLLTDQDRTDQDRTDQDRTDQSADRFHHGFRWAEREFRRWSDLVLREATQSVHPDYHVWRLLFGRARQAAVYHGRYQLEGRPLSEWFADVDSGPDHFLDALAASPLVRPGKPDRSPLLRGLIAETGPMFRVFTDDEVAAIRRWIEQLPTAGPDASRGPARHGLNDVQQSWFRQTAESFSRPAGAGSARAGTRPASTRDAYRRLLTRQDCTALRQYARDYAERWLTRSEFRLDAVPNQLPKRWNRNHGLSPWLLAEHDRHGEEFSEGEAPVPTREQLISSTLQLAPLIMIDGAWLQGFTDYRLASTPVGHLLFQTYWDELGNGVRDLNHPLIYRELLRQMGHDLPPTASDDFAQWAEFHNESFDLPVFWLSISRFPQTFQPEILGLNLAMELSGVGGSYRSARVGLEKHGFSTQFVDLHNTIDNVATGHSAWAAEAVDHFMDQVPRALGPAGELEMWRRIRTGYRSLNGPRTLGSALYARIRSRRRQSVPPPLEGADPL